LDLFGPAPGIIDAVNKSTDALNATIEQAVTVAQAADVNIRYVDVTEGLRDTASSVTSPSSMRPVYPRRFHPNAAGHDVCFDAISASLPTGWVDKQKQLE
jgi:lysophospholipase L1-like esterase